MPSGRATTPGKPPVLWKVNDFAEEKETKVARGKTICYNIPAKGQYYVGIMRPPQTAVMKKSN